MIQMLIFNTNDSTLKQN